MCRSLDSYIGVSLDSTLSSEKHIANKIRMARASKAALYPFLGKRSKLSSHNKMILHSQLFSAAILYPCSVCWAHAINSSFKRLNSFQKVFVKMALNVPWFAKRRLIMKQGGIPTIEE